MRTSSRHPRLRRVRWPRRCRDLALHGRTGYGGTCAGASAPIFAEPSYLEPKIRSGNAVWSPETFAKFFVKRARCALVLIVGLLLSPRRRAPWLSCDGCSAVPRRWARHIRPGQSPLHHGADAAWHCSRPGRGTGAATAPLREPPFLCGQGPLGVGRQCKAVAGARQRCAPLGPPGSGQAWPVEPPVVMPVAGCSPCPRTIVHSPDRPTWPLRWVGDVDCGVHLVPTFGRPAGPELVRWSSPGRGSLLPR